MGGLNPKPDGEVIVVGDMIGGARNHPLLLLEEEEDKLIKSGSRYLREVNLGGGYGYPRSDGWFIRSIVNCSISYGKAKENAMHKHNLKSFRVETS